MYKLFHRRGNGIGILSIVVLTSLWFHRLEGEALSPHGDNSLNIKNGHHNAYLAAAAQLLANATQIESFATNFCNPTLPEFRTSWAGDRSRIKVAEVLRKTSYTQYTNISKNFLVNYRKSDLIFPFHYYW